MSVNILTISKKYNTQAKCLALLEEIRWGKTVTCPYCDSSKTRPVKSEAGRHSCKSCKRTFSVLIDTIFEGTRLPLPKWFMVIGSILNAKGGISAKELQRNYGLTYKTAYYTAMRVRIGMLMPETALHGILEMDESYFGGKARKGNLRENAPNLSQVYLKRGRGTSKISVAGIVERKGNVKTKVLEKLSKRNLLAMLRRYSAKDDSILITDGFSSYKKLNEYIEHLIINHSKQFSKGFTHINSIEGFWSYVKNGIRGSFKSISPKYLPFYLVMYEWNYNTRNLKTDLFRNYLQNALNQEKEMLYWKAESKEQIKEIVYS
jgi:transposase-like protein